MNWAGAADSPVLEHPERLPARAARQPARTVDRRAQAPATVSRLRRDRSLRDRHLETPCEAPHRTEGGAGRLDHPRSGRRGRLRFVDCHDLRTYLTHGSGGPPIRSLYLPIPATASNGKTVITYSLSLPPELPGSRHRRLPRR